MVPGDVVGDIQLVDPDGDPLAIQPPTGEEWEITNIYANDPIMIYRVGVGGLFAIDTTTAALAANYHITVTDFLYVIPVSSITLVGFDGIMTRRPPRVFD
jgi:hypothetical protein